MDCKLVTRSAFPVSATQLRFKADVCNAAPFAMALFPATMPPSYPKETERRTMILTTMRTGASAAYKKIATIGLSGAVGAW
jgi:hypothetical protein